MGKKFTTEEPAGENLSQESYLEVIPWLTEEDQAEEDIPKQKAGFWIRLIRIALVVLLLLISFVGIPLAVGFLDERSLFFKLLELINKIFGN